VAFFLVADMKEHFVIDPLISKRQQLLLATQLCRMVLKVRYASYCILSFVTSLSLPVVRLPLPFDAGKLARYTRLLAFVVVARHAAVRKIVLAAPPSLALR
jgi:hypothetical protein